MSKKILILFLSLQLNNCAIQGNGTVKPSAPVNSITPSVQASTGSSTNPDDKYKGLEIYSQDDNQSKTLYCESSSNIKAELKYPVKIVVSKDGNTVYTINGKCSRTPFLPQSFRQDEICQDEKHKFAEKFSRKKYSIKN